MYIGILFGSVAMPEDIDEDIQARNEINYLLCGFKRRSTDDDVASDLDIVVSSRHSSDDDQEFIINPITTTLNDDKYNKTNSCDDPTINDNDNVDANNNRHDLKLTDRLSTINNNDTADDPASDRIQCMSRHTPSVKYHVSLAFIERAYIIFWISKDFFWSVGTGEVFNYRPMAPIWEGLAMIMGCSAIFVYVAGCYVYRRDFMQLLDNVSTIMWICANFVWMCGKLCYCC